MTNLSYNDIELRGRDETAELNVKHIFIYYYEELQSSGTPSEARMHDIADTFGCNIPTANRIKRSGVIDDAITQVGRKIVVDADLALELAANVKKNGKEVAS